MQSVMKENNTTHTFVLFLFNRVLLFLYRSLTIALTHFNNKNIAKYRTATIHLVNSLSTDIYTYSVFTNYK